MAKFCFVISPIGEPGSADRRRADGVLEEIVKPAVGHPDGYRVERADHDKSPGIVTDSIIGKLLEADLVVADLTGVNPNVMYELALRHATEKPVVQIMELGQQLPFDIQAQNTIYFAGDLYGRTKAISDIRAAVEAVEGSANLGNPVRRAVQFRALLASGSPDLRSLAQAVSEMQSQLSTMNYDAQVGRLLAEGPRSSEMTSPSRSLMSMLLHPERKAVALMRADLRNLVTVEEAHLADHTEYTKDLLELPFIPSSGVRVTVTHATANGWRAIATHQGVPEKYSMYIGDGGGGPIVGVEGEPTPIQ